MIMIHSVIPCTYLTSLSLALIYYCSAFPAMIRSNGPQVMLLWLLLLLGDYLMAA